MGWRQVLKKNLRKKDPKQTVWPRIMLGPPAGRDPVRFYRKLVEDADAADQPGKRHFGVMARVGLACVVEDARPDEAERLWSSVVDAMAEKWQDNAQTWMDMWIRSVDMICRHKRTDRLGQMAARRLETPRRSAADEYTPVAAAVADMARKVSVDPDAHRIGGNTWGKAAVTVTGSSIDLQEPGSNMHCDEISSSPRRFMTSYAYWGDPLMMLPARQGRRWLGVCNTSGPCRAKVHIAMRRRIEATSAKVRTPAGVFGRCVVVHAEHALATSLAGMPVDQNMKGWITGVRREWWAPGFGMVLMEYDHANGRRTRIEMVDHDVKAGGKTLFPRREGSRWEYQWLDGDDRVFLREFHRVGQRMGKATRLGQAAYGYVLDD